MNTYFLSAPDEATLRAALLDAGYEMDGQYGLRFTLPDWTPCENHTPGAVRHDVDVLGAVETKTGTVWCAHVTAHELHPALAALSITMPEDSPRKPCVEPVVYGAKMEVVEPVKEAGPVSK